MAGFIVEWSYDIMREKPMNFLHTSDWHIGRTLNEKSLLEDQSFILKKLLVLLKDEHPEALVIAGDIYDRSVPSKEAMGMVDDFLSEVILNLKIPTIMIGGNHDGRERLAFSGGILKKQGLYIVGNYAPDIEPVILKDKWGEICFWCVPFIKPIEYRHLKESDALHYDTMYQEIIEDITERMDQTKRNVLITHGLILGGAKDIETIDDSVRPIEIGGVEYAHAEDFEAFDYVALGHLHRPQKVLRDTLRYSGSLLKYSFSEAKQQKSVTMVEMKKKGEVNFTTHILETKRDLRVIKGKLSDLTALDAYDKPGKDDYLKVILEDEDRLVRPMDRLRKVYPNVLEMEYEVREKTESQRKTGRIKERIQDPMGLFEDFYNFIYDENMKDDERAVISDLFKSIEEDEV